MESFGPHFWIFLTKFTVNIPDKHGGGPGGGDGGVPSGGGGGGPDVGGGGEGGGGDGGGPGGGVSISDIVSVGDTTDFFAGSTVQYLAGRMHFIYIFPGFLNIIHIMD